MDRNLMQGAEVVDPISSRLPRSGITRWAAVGLLATLAACGGGGQEASTPAPPPVSPLALPEATPGTETFARVRSSNGDRVGLGGDRAYSLKTAGIFVQTQGSALLIRVNGEEYWEGWIQTNSSFGGKVVEGVHTGLRLNRFAHGPEVGIDWRREDVGCDGAEGILSVDKARYVDDRLVEVEFRMAQRCDGDTGNLQVQLRWKEGEQPVRDGPAPLPAGLWRPSSEASLPGGNLVHLESEGVEPVLSGESLTLTEQDAVLDVASAGSHIDIVATGHGKVIGRLRGIQRPEALEVGFYGGLRGLDHRYNPARGAIEWWFVPRWCDDPRGWLAIDRIEWREGALDALEFRFEQRCPGVGAGALRGLVRWQAAAKRLPPRPAEVPAGLWEPPPGAVPADGDFVYLESTDASWVQPAGSRLLTPADTQFVVYDDAGTLKLRLNERSAAGAEWYGDFRGRYNAARVEVGYRQLSWGQDWNPAIGQVVFSGASRGCTLASSWFAVDAVSHRHGVLRSIQLRFGFTCDDRSGDFRGMLRWTNADDSLWSGMADPPLPEARLAPEPEMPASGSAFLLRSRGNDFIGQGQNWLYTTKDAQLSVGRFQRGMAHLFQIFGDEYWIGSIRPAVVDAPLTVGRFAITADGPLEGSGGHTFDWSGLGNGCDNTSGWFDISHVAYVGERLTEIDMTFEQFCGSSPYPLLGTIRWRADEPREPLLPGPIPEGLWAPPVGSLPASGNFMYLQSNMGGFIGAGRTILNQPAPDRLLYHEGPDSWRFVFGSTEDDERMDLFLRSPREAGPLLAGFYDQSKWASRAGNPFKVGVDLNAGSRGCNQTAGWLAIDDIAYDALGLVRISMRLMQICDGAGPPTFAAMRWER